MIPISVLAVFFSTSILLALAPGPDNIFVLTQAAIRGRLAGLVITLGLCTGLVVHTFAVASGIAAIFQVSAIAFAALKLVGAAYLLYLAFGAFRASATDLTGVDNSGTSLSQLYRRGIIMNITNPKVSIFFLAFLPQFADPYRGSLMLQIVILGFVFIVSAILVFGAISVLMSRIAGTVYVALALKLAAAEM
ncbi:MAG: LysE family translocator [Deltaproteobacteria bacterium]|nr:LysE family translocator [Deltaproteobacteria bacterium]